MKKILLLVFFGLLAARVSAVQLYEAFTYPPASSLAGQGGWVLTAGTSPTIQAGSLTTPGLMPPSDGNSLLLGGTQMEVRHALTNLLDPSGSTAYNGAYWYSLAFKVTSLGSMTINGDFIAAFSQSTVTTAYGGLLWLRKDLASTPNGYNIGVAKTSGLGGTVEWSPDVFLVGQTNFVVCKYATPDQGDSSTYLWINPDPSGFGAASAPAYTLNATAGTDSLTGVNQFLLHQTSGVEGSSGIVVDQIRVQGAWASVTPVPLTITTTITNDTDLFLSWGGNQDVYIQRTTSLTPPVTWTNLNGGTWDGGNNGSLRNYTISNYVNDPVPKFYRIHAWYVE